MLQGLAALQGNKLFLMLLEHHHSTLWSALPGRSGPDSWNDPFLDRFEEIAVFVQSVHAP